MSFNFSQIGLSGRDKRVYEALLILRHASVRTIAEKTAINRGSVHESLLALQKGGLISFTLHGKRKRFVAHAPYTIHEIIDEKRRSLASAHSDIDDYISSLKQIQVSTDLPFATSFEDNEGLASILRDVIFTMKDTKEKLYRVISSADVSEYLYHNFSNYTAERIKHRIAVKVISHERSSEASLVLATRRILHATQIRVPRCYIIIYGRKTAFIALSDINVPHGVIIDNTDVTQLQIALFEKLWRDAE